MSYDFPIRDLEHKTFKNGEIYNILPTKKAGHQPARNLLIYSYLYTSITQRTRSETFETPLPPILIPQGL